MKGIFVSGTNTEIGKTLVSAALMTRASQIYKTVSYHKPIQTGMPADNDAQTVADLMSRPTLATTGISFSKPLSPHLAAHYDNQVIDFNAVVDRAHQLCIGEFNILEGAGGLLVPINHRYLMIDLIKQLNLPCVLVVNSKLGTINHTLLSMEALRSRDVPLLGIIMNGHRNRDNERSIQFYGRVDNVMSLPWLPSINRDSLLKVVSANADYLDRFLRG